MCVRLNDTWTTFYLSHFNVLSIGVGHLQWQPNHSADKQRLEGIHPHQWSHISEVQKSKSERAEVSRGRSITALQVLNSSPNTR